MFRQFFVPLLAAFATVAFADDCTVTEQNLVGGWVAESGATEFQKMAFASDQDGKTFSSWLHERPEILGTAWSLEACVLRITHPTDSIQSYEYRVKQADKGRLILEVGDDNEVSEYKRVPDSRY